MHGPRSRTIRGVARRDVADVRGEPVARIRAHPFGASSGRGRPWPRSRPLRSRRSARRRRRRPCAPARSARDGSRRRGTPRRAALAHGEPAAGLRGSSGAGPRDRSRPARSSAPRSASRSRRRRGRAPLAAPGSLLRVVQEGERPNAMIAQKLVVEEDSGDYEGTGKRATPGLVSAGDEASAELGRTSAASAPSRRLPPALLLRAHPPQLLRQRARLLRALRLQARP